MSEALRQIKLSVDLQTTSVNAAITALNRNMASVVDAQRLLTEQTILGTKASKDQKNAIFVAKAAIADEKIEVNALTAALKVNKVTLKEWEAEHMATAAQAAAVSKTLTQRRIADMGAIAAARQAQYAFEDAELLAHKTRNEAIMKAAHARQVARIKAEDAAEKAREATHNKMIERLEAAHEARRSAILAKGLGHRLNLRRAANAREAAGVARGPSLAGTARGKGTGLKAGVGPGTSYGYASGGGGLAAGLIGGMVAYATIKKTTGAYLEQEKALYRVMSLVGDNERAAGASFGMIRRDAQGLARDIGIGVPEALEAMREAITTNVSPFLAAGYVKGVAALSLSEGIDVKGTTALLATLKNAFGLTADEMERLPDVIFTLMDEGRLKLKQFSAQAGDMAGIAKAMGWEVVETLSAVTALTRQGMSSARAATSIRALGEIVLKGPTAKVASRRREEGLDLSMENVKAMGLARTIELIKTTVESSNYNLAELLGGRSRALKGVIQLIGEANDDYHEIMVKANAANGISAKKLAEMTSGPAQRMERLGQTLQTGFADIGSGFVESFMKSLGPADEFADTLAMIADHMRSIGTGIGGLIGVFKTVTPVLMTISTLGMNQLAGPIRDLIRDALKLIDVLPEKAGSRTITSAETNLEMGTQRNIHARSKGYKDWADQKEHLDWLEDHKKRMIVLQKATVMNYDVLLSRQKVEIKLVTEHAEKLQKKADDKKSWAKQEKTERTALLKLQEAEIKGAQKLLDLAQSATDAKAEFLAKEEARRTKASMAGRDVTGLEKFARARMGMNEATDLARTATTADEAKKALAEMSKLASEMGSMDLSAILGAFAMERSAAVAGIAGIVPGDSFQDKYEKRKAAKAIIDRARAALISERGKKGRFGGAAARRDAMVSEVGTAAFDRLDQEAMDQAQERTDKAMEYEAVIDTLATKWDDIQKAMEKAAKFQAKMAADAAYWTEQIGKKGVTTGDTKALLDTARAAEAAIGNTYTDEEWAAIAQRQNETGGTTEVGRYGLAKQRADAALKRGKDSYTGAISAYEQSKLPSQVGAASQKVDASTTTTYNTTVNVKTPEEAATVLSGLDSPASKARRQDHDRKSSNNIPTK